MRQNSLRVRASAVCACHKASFCRVRGGPEHDQDDFGWRFGFSSDRDSWR
jgi:hypothetical protein